VQTHRLNGDIISLEFLFRKESKLRQGSGMQRVTQNLVGEVGVSYINARKEGSGIPFCLCPDKELPEQHISYIMKT
jgi:hypothetical protein